ncbi:MAG: 3-oxoacyl-ACP synthase III [Deltaproteobacteria bacterium]|nr:3-oxoacyl-ACP synthase III [Deltaproteobacteria bacterium]
MLWENVAIESVDIDLPDKVVTSEQLENALSATMERFGMEKGLLERISGIKERRWYDSLELPSAIATRAAERALDRAGISAGQVDMLINGSVTRDYDEPATATIVGGNLGVKHHCFTMDISHACLGFVTAMTQAANAIELGQANHVLVTSGENAVRSLMVDINRLKAPDCHINTFRRAFATLTIGTGGAAMVLSRREHSKSGHRLKGALGVSANEHNQLCVGTWTGGMQADTAGLLEHGTGLLIESYPKAAAMFGWEDGDIDQFISHQVSNAHFERVFNALGQPLDRNFRTLSYLGNVASASIPITLVEAERAGKVKSGDQLCFYGAGSGLGAMIMNVGW